MFLCKMLLLKKRLKVVIWLPVMMVKEIKWLLSSAKQKHCRPLLTALLKKIFKIILIKIRIRSQSLRIFFAQLRIKG
ncbi:hypothetical protein GALL_108650 [mine drainage metagenome]|uniref:Uncharacterized protein n=1 Tax=mine drainage metagenome TaxID=410659 RepID=A0A1J5SEY1_9ZZZZ